ncbi:MAG: DNA excision repair protein ERCC-2 [Halioglobus sp.]|jgi:DNA excision repair protein ERCC-2
MMADFTVSVRDLAEFCYRSGDIDHRFTPSPTGVQGTEGHQRVFSKRPDSYISEYAVEYNYSDGECELALRGRADGYDAIAGVVEEIKTCRVSPDSIPESVVQVHLAQARLYAALVAQSENLEKLDVHLTWFNIDTEQEWTSSYTYSAEEMAEFLKQALKKYSSWLNKLLLLKKSRDKSIVAMAFPYGDFRPGQRDIAELVYKCVDQGGQLLLEAPTGIGKTSAVLFPALKALAAGKHERLLYLTAKSVGRRAAEHTLAHFRESGFIGVALSLTAKDKICFSPGKACHRDDCRYAQDYYDKLPEAMEAAIDAPSLVKEDVEALASRFELCPYQLMLDLLPWVDIVIADLHYFYSLTPIFSQLIDGGDQRWTALVDEAHNLPPRARAMYSADLTKAGLMRAKSQLGKKASRPVLRSLEKINRQMLALQNETWQESAFESRREPSDALLDTLQRLVAEVGGQVAENPAYLHRLPDLKAFFFDVLQFMRVAENWGEDYRFEMTRLVPAGSVDRSKQSLRLRLNCLDPARLLMSRQKQLHALNVFSATLSPVDWVHAGLGLRKDAVCRRLNSPFSAEQLEVSLATQIDTRYKARSISLPALAKLLEHWILQESGNCIVYFPSYRYMEDCVSLMLANGLEQRGLTLWWQSSQQGESAREELLNLLESARNVLAFCMLGGVFGEGIDLPGERLSAVAVVGVGLPQMNKDTEQLQSYFEARHGQGFRYACLYPGMQKVDQALGRVIRRGVDTGRALLVDSRYAQHEYRDLLPPWWTYRVYPHSQLPALVKSFIT